MRRPTYLSQNHSLKAYLKFKLKSRNLRTEKVLNRYSHLDLPVLEEERLFLFQEVRLSWEKLHLAKEAFKTTS